MTREIWALKDIDLEIEPGTVQGIIGRNGAGKTTLLKILARITPPTEGEASICGRVVSLLEIGTGFQPDLSGRENVFLNAAIYGVKRQEVQARLDDIIAFAELDKFIDSPIRHYSSGMYLRLAFSVAINMGPDILLADEVLAVGDIGFQHKCIERMRAVGEAGTTVLFVSHDMDAINRLCTKCLRLDDGKIVDAGAPEEVTARYRDAMAKGFVSDAPSQVSSQTSIPEGKIVAVDILSPTMSEIGAATVDQENNLRLTFEVSIPDAEVFCSFDVYAKGVHLFRTVPEKTFSLAEPGVYHVVAKIPAGLLAELEYTVNAGVRIIKEGKEYFLNAYHALTFRGYKAGEEGNGTAALDHRVVGLIRPILEWKLVK